MVAALKNPQREMLHNKDMCDWKLATLERLDIKIFTNRRCSSESSVYRPQQVRGSNPRSANHFRIRGQFSVARLITTPDLMRS